MTSAITFLSPLFFALALVLSGLLMWLVQPIIGKMILLPLGGTPQAWNTAMLFFVVVSLAGYFYSHAVASLLRLRYQVIVHSTLLLLALAVLLRGGPFDIRRGWVSPPGANPVPATLVLLTTVVGLPFFAVASTIPLLPRWFADSRHPAAADPYFLYAAAGLGAVLALVGYPVLVEPLFPLYGSDSETWGPRFLSQRWLWAFGFILMLGMVGVCAGAVWNSSRAAAMRPALADLFVPSGLFSCLRWGLLAAFPLWLVAVELEACQRATEEVTASPLLPHVPLILCWITLTLAFAQRPRVPTLPRPTARFLQVLDGLLLLVLAAVLFLPPVSAGVPVYLAVPAVLFLLLLPGRWAVFLQPAMTLLMLWVALSWTPGWGQLSLHLAAFYVTVRAYHAELAWQRPAGRYATGYFLWMVAGPILFSPVGLLLQQLPFPAVLVEYPLATGLLVFLLKVPGVRRKNERVESGCPHP